jgi:hypothetical protein
MTLDDVDHYPCMLCTKTFDTARKLNGHRAWHGKAGRKQCDGTWQDYMRHHKHGETKCAESKVAWRIESEARKRRQVLRLHAERAAEKELTQEAQRLGLYE